MKEKGENCFFLEKNIKQKKPSFRVKNCLFASRIKSKLKPFSIKVPLRNKINYEYQQLFRNSRKNLFAIKKVSIYSEIKVL